MEKGTNPVIGLSHTAEGPATSPVDEDADHVALVRAGDLSAFEFLVTKYQKRMLNLSYRVTNDHDEACEVVQDAFVAAYKNLATFRGEAKFTTWLTTITLNLSRNKLKQMRSQQGRIAYSLDEPMQTSDGELTGDAVSKEPSILDRLETRELQSRVQDCIKALEPDFREALVLRDLQDFSYEEIGSILKVREGTIKSRIFRARESVKDCLKKCMGKL